VGLIDNELIFIEHRAACEKIKKTIREREARRDQNIEASPRFVPGSFVIPSAAGRTLSAYYAVGPELVPMPPAKAYRRR
jgi:hypothetical protein